MSANINGYVAGNDIDIENNVPNVSVSDPLLEALLTLKVSPTDLDASAVLQKRITTTQAAGVGQITQDGSEENGNGTGAVWFQISKAESLALGSAIRYYYDIRAFTTFGMSFNVVLDDTVDPPIMVGSILLEDSVTDATV